MFNPQPTTLTTDKVVLEPLTYDDVVAFQAAGAPDEIWRWMPVHRCENRKVAAETVNNALAATEAGEQVAFKIVDRYSGKLVGSTRYLSIEREHRTLEIGHTFIHPDFQRTHVNTHAKFLLLSHAFEQLNANRVQLKTHENNQNSRRAIARVGGQFEGIIRNERLNPDGTARSSACFSIVPAEWPQLKLRLASLL